MTCRLGRRLDLLLMVVSVLVKSELPEFERPGFREMMTILVPSAVFERLHCRIAMITANIILCSDLWLLFSF